MASDGLATVGGFDLVAGMAALEELSPVLMPAAPNDGRCPRATLWKSSCKSRGCPVCGPRWARNQRTKIGTNLEYLGGSFATIAVTGPGADVLPWDEEHCRHKKPHAHAGPKGCRVDQKKLREWCATLTWRWAKLRQAAQLATHRELGERVWIIERVWEPQKRGVPHLHLVVPFGTPWERKVAETFRRHLEERSHDYGFGNVQGKLQPIDGAAAARYLASYLAGRRQKKNSIRENIADPRLPKSLLWETPVLSSVSDSPRMSSWRERYGISLGTGITMRTLRRTRHLWACFEGFCEEWPVWSGMEEAVIVAAVFRRTNPKRAGPLGEQFPAILRWARTVDRVQERLGGWDRFAYDPERRPNYPLYKRMIAVAFKETRPVLEAAAA